MMFCGIVDSNPGGNNGLRRDDADDVEDEGLRRGLNLFDRSGGLEGGELKLPSLEVVTGVGWAFLVGCHCLDDEWVQNLVGSRCSGEGNLEDLCDVMGNSQ